MATETGVKTSATLTGILDPTQKTVLTPTRLRVMDFVHQEGSVLAVQVKDLLEVGWTATLRHLHQLRQVGLLVQHPVGNRTYWVAKNGPRQNRTEMVLRDLTRPETGTGRVYHTVRTHKGATVSRLASLLETSPGHVHYHLRRLERAGLLRRKAHGRRVRNYAL